MWTSLAVSLLVAMLFTLPIVWLLGWRRPGAGPDEELVFSALFMFALVFLATWAFSGFLPDWGPLAWEVPWLLFLVVGALVALLLIVASPTPSYSTADDTTAGVVRAAEGIGLLFWILIVVLLIIGVVGNTRMID